MEAFSGEAADLVVHFANIARTPVTLIPVNRRGKLHLMSSQQMGVSVPSLPTNAGSQKPLKYRRRRPEIAWSFVWDFFSHF